MLTRWRIGFRYPLPPYGWLVIIIDGTQILDTSNAQVHSLTVVVRGEFFVFLLYAQASL